MNSDDADGAEQYRQHGESEAYRRGFADGGVHVLGLDPKREDTMLELRPEVAAFAQAMEAQLRANDHKPGWKGIEPDALLDRLREERRELEVAVLQIEVYAMGNCSPANTTHYVGRVVKEAADVANFAMMVADVCGGLET